MRRSSWSATPCATRRASTSGLRISTMLRLTSRAGHRAQQLLQLLDVAALLADDHARARGIDADPADLGRTLDHHLGDRRLGQRLHDVAADLEILEQQAAVILAFREPAAVPGPVDLQAKPDRRGFLTHYASSCSRTTTRMLAERLDDAARAAAGAGGETLHRDRLADAGFGDDQSIDVEVVVVLGIGDGRREHLADVVGHALGRELQNVERFLDLAAADQARDQVELPRRPTDGVADGQRFLVADLARGCCLAISACPSGRRRGRGRSGSARTRRASFRPCPH